MWVFPSHFACETSRPEQLCSFNKRPFPRPKATKITSEKSSVSTFSVCTWIHFRIFWQLEFGKQFHFLKQVVYFEVIELSCKWQTYICLSFPCFCSVTDKMTLRIKNELENIYDQLEPQFFSKIGFSISHYSKCHTPFGVSLHHFTMDLVYISPSLMQSITNTDKKKEKRKGSPIPLSCEVLWWGKILAQDRVWCYTSQWFHTAFYLQFLPILQYINTKENRDTSALCWEHSNTWSMAGKGQILEWLLKSLFCNFFSKGHINL